MTAFVVTALLLALLAAGFVAQPLLRRAATPAAHWLAVSATIALIVCAFGLYTAMADPHWNLDAAAPAQQQEIPNLVHHVDADPGDLAGWLRLGQAYTAIGQYPLALRAYERANRLGNGGNSAALAGMGETLTLSGDAAQRDKALELFEHALQLDPQSPKALFYTAVAALEGGRLELARQRFAAMLALQPPETVQAALRSQIAAIDAKLSSTVDPRTAIRVHVTVTPEFAAQIPATAVLFVFVEAPQGGAPLAVRRLGPTFPQDVTLSAADAMVAGRSVKSGQAVTVAARISASGSPLAAAGDLYGQIRYVTGKDALRELRIDRRQ